MNAEERVLAWRFFDGDGSNLVEGQVQTFDDPAGSTGPWLLGRTMAESIMDAWCLAEDRTCICRVECWGIIARDDTSIAARNYKAVWWFDGEKFLKAFLYTCVHNMLRQAGLVDDRCWSGIKTARLALVGKATEDELLAATKAAHDAVEDSYNTPQELHEATAAADMALGHLDANRLQMAAHHMAWWGLKHTVSRNQSLQMVRDWLSAEMIGFMNICAPSDDIPPYGRHEFILDPDGSGKGRLHSAKALRRARLDAARYEQPERSGT